MYSLASLPNRIILLLSRLFVILLFMHNFLMDLFWSTALTESLNNKQADYIKGNTLIVFIKVASYYTTEPVGQEAELLSPNIIVLYMKALSHKKSEQTRVFIMCSH